MMDRTKSGFHRRAGIWLTLAAFLSPFSALGQDTAWDVNDLVGIRASSGEMALLDRGYVFVKVEKGDDRAWSNWWNRSTHSCITVATMNGRYNSIVTSPPFDCGREDMTSGGTPERREWAEGLLGARATALDSEMESRGFRNVDSYKDPEQGLSTTWWYQSDGDVCLRAEVFDGRIQNIVPTPHYPACF